jgi:SulP family sulfate permease
VNVASGATSKMSQFLNGVIVLLIVTFCLPYFSFIPMPVIASILITSAVRLIPFDMIQYLFKIDKFECFILLLTAGICIYADGAMGLMYGGLFTLLNYA